MMFSVDKTKREAWMPVWPARMSVQKFAVICQIADHAAVFHSLADALTHFHMPRAALVEVAAPVTP